MGVLCSFTLWPRKHPPGLSAVSRDFYELSGLDFWVFWAYSRLETSEGWTARPLRGLAVQISGFQPLVGPENSKISPENSKKSLERADKPGKYHRSLRVINSSLKEYKLLWQKSVKKKIRTILLPYRKVKGNAEKFHPAPLIDLLVY